jgi:hypothetical protein
MELCLDASINNHFHDKNTFRQLNDQIFQLSKVYKEEDYLEWNNLIQGKVQSKDRNPEEINHLTALKEKSNHQEKEEHDSKSGRN